MKIVVMLICVAMLAGCQNTSTNEGNQNGEEGAVYRKISAKEAKDMMEEEGILILDVREQNEYVDGHVQGATLLPVGVIQAGDLKLIPDKDQKLLVYCRSGNRSGKAAKKLVEYGYTNVYDFGGIIDWPYEVVK